LIGGKVLSIPHSWCACFKLSGGWDPSISNQWCKAYIYAYHCLVFPIKLTLGGWLCQLRILCSMHNQYKLKLEDVDLEHFKLIWKYHIE
jgi:hypothetical protein